ncbi:Ldh family oxidoreductase [Gelria sp. Kuro-4]|uniref:Ldh family oxidoreductase n=1 Tax=Gelria sp. Kuro-4 TaxID=2796927 RepID=UPI001BEF7A3C|nr:Ldh family oxidoreductase [Gelria sp. Kuro-4]BCV24899.1 malate dehydrogenase [Gelria sp. Kuro-4]
MALVRVQSKDLQHLAEEILQSVGVPEEDAHIISSCLIEADLRGVQTHGMFHLPKYVARIQVGSLKPVTPVTTVAETANIAVLDGGGGFGHVSGYRAMKLAMAKAKQGGIAMVLVRNSNHFGMTAFYAMLALSENQIGMAMTNASPTIAPTGGVSPLLGNNPFAIAVPAGQRPAPVLDVALSASSLSKIKQAAEKGIPIPLGWATDPEGEETTDAQKAVTGLLLPIGGYKGYGMSFMIDVLCGVLSGAAFGPFVGKHLQQPNQKANPQNLGHTFVAIDVSKFMGVDLFKARVDQYIDTLKASKLGKSAQTIYLPGEKEYWTKTDYLKNGIRIEEAIVNEVVALANSLGLAPHLNVALE